MKKISVVTTICASILCMAYFQCKTSNIPDPRGDLYAGSAACAKCHGNVYASYLHTAHHLATVPAGINTVHGSFAAGANEVYFSSSKKIVMENRDSGLFQTYVLNGKPVERHRFDVVLGGIKGESYLYWDGNGLNQLPVSYYSGQNQWLVSPGYIPGQVYFNRPIATRCMECHSSYIADMPGETKSLTRTEQFDKGTLLYGIDCERCHGPAAQHVEFQTDNPGIKTARFIARFSSLPRERRLDVCAMCHSGNKSQMLRSTFGFRPGDTLANFKLPGLVSTIDTAHLDVHGNQLQLLESSRCFAATKMDCSTCHDVHQNQRGNIALFTQKCMSCHSPVKHNYCKLATPANAKLIASNCIRCHMPALPSKIIMAPSGGQSSSADILVHTHHIAVYPGETKKVLSMKIFSPTK